MPVVYNDDVKNDRLNVVRDAIDAAASPGYIEIGTTGMASILATIPLEDPSAPDAAGGVLTFTTPIEDESADNTGTAAEARIRDGDDVDIVTGLTVGTGGTDVVLNSTSISSGQRVEVTSATITHG